MPQAAESQAGDREGSVQRYRTLLEVTEAIAQHRDLNALFRELAARLRTVADFDFIQLVLQDPARGTARLQVVETFLPTSVQPGFELPLEETPAGEVIRTQQPYCVEDVRAQQRYPSVHELALQQGIHSACILPLTTAQQQLGVVVFGSTKTGTYRDGEVDFLAHVAQLIAVAVENALNYQALLHTKERFARDRDRLSLLLQISEALMSKLDFRELFVEVSSRHREVHPEHDFASVTLFDKAAGQLRVYALDFPKSKGLLKLDMTIPLDGSPAGHVFRTQEVLQLCPLDTTRFPADITRLLVAEGLQCCCWVPLQTRNGVLGTFCVGRLRAEPYPPDDMEYLRKTSGHMAIAIENALAFKEIAELKDKLQEEKLYLEDEIRTEFNFDEIVGDSPALKRILKQVEIVAPTDSTVLLLGETGTGKELLARAIHKLSPRAQRTFVKVNCASIPAGLLESELFGHEKGAFTGAIAQKIGRLELADKGTIFLDEVGDLPLELQPKLLRALQEHEFERLGSSHTRRVDVRIVAATNRDLSRMVADGQFRSDLYYRLYVFPVQLPPLRERVEDIPTLVRYFVQKYARRLNRRINTIPVEAMRALTEWTWPGNIRELENFIERAVILSTGPVLNVAVKELKAGRNQASRAHVPIPTLADAEREHILLALREAKGVVAGPHGAAARLGLKRTTLQSKMQKLGIRREDL